MVNKWLDVVSEQHRDLRVLRNIFKTAMPWLQFFLGSRHCLLYLWKMLKNIAKWKGGWQEQQRYRGDTRLFYQEEWQARCQTWTFRTTTNVLQGSRNVAQSWSKETWRTLISSCEVAQRIQLQRFVDTHWMDHAIWHNCLGKSFIRRNKSWENSKLRTLDSKNWIRMVLSNR